MLFSGGFATLEVSWAGDVARRVSTRGRSQVHGHQGFSGLGIILSVPLGPKKLSPNRWGPIRWEVNSDSLVGPYFVGLPLEGCCAG